MTTPLITRLEEAAEGSRELDCDLAEAFGEVPENAFRMHGVMAGRYGTGPYSAWTAPAYSTSLDAALALAERVLPEMNCIGFDKTPHGVEAYVSRNNVKSGHWVVVGEHPSSPAIALCIATIKANHKDKP